MIFIFGLIFQIPLLFLLLIKFKKIDKISLKKFRKYYIILSFTIGAIFTPTDIFSQIFIAVIMILFYEIMVFFTKDQSPKDSWTKVKADIIAVSTLKILGPRLIE